MTSRMNNLTAALSFVQRVARSLDLAHIDAVVNIIFASETTKLIDLLR